MSALLSLFQVAFLAHMLGTLGFVLVGALGNRLVGQRRLQFDGAVLAVVVREWAAIVCALPSLAFGLGQPPPPRVAGARPPVLLVHGYGLNRSSMWLIRRYLLGRGHQAVWCVNHSPRHAPLPVLARGLVRQIEALKAATGADQVDIVGHSMGGVLAGWAAARLDAARDIRRLVTLGSPWRGTRMGFLAWHPEARDLAPDSAVIADLDPRVIPVVSIWSPEDNIILPAESSVMDGMVTQVIAGAGHTELLLRPSVWRAVAEALDVADLALLPPTVLPSERRLPELSAELSAELAG